VRKYGKGLALCTPMAGRSAISERVASILDLNRRRKTVNKLKILAATAVTVAFVAPLATLKSQETATGASLGDAEFEALLANGPADDEALEAAVRGYLEDDEEDSAAALLEAYIWKHGADCGFCSQILRGEGMAPAAPLQNVLRKAFDGLDRYAEERHSGQRLLDLAVISAASGNRNASNRGLFYLMEGFRLGNLDDDAPLRAIGFFNLTNRYEEGLALARKVYSDPASSLYQAKALEGWITYFERMAENSSVITERLLTALGQQGSSDGDYLPIYKQSPVYPKDAALQGLEGAVIVEFVVTESGRTKDVKVVSSTNNLFDAAAVEAASQFLYAPRIVGGVPVEIPGVRNKITFVLESHG
jgi:TonB family protein